MLLLLLLLLLFELLEFPEDCKFHLFAPEVDHFALILDGGGVGRISCFLDLSEVSIVH